MRSVSALIFVIVLAIAGAIYTYDSGNDEPVGPVESLASESNADVDVGREPPQRSKAEAVRFPVAEALAAKDHIISFGNGREVAVNLKQSPRSVPYNYPTEQFIDIYYDLEEAALAGESTAAIQLFTNLKACQYAHRSKDELDQALKRARDEGKVEWLDGRRGPQQIPPGFDYSQYEERLKDNFVFCEGITDEQTDNHEKWARLAIDAGDYYGTRLLTEELGRTQESFELWQRAWDQGHINSTTALLLYYRDGTPDYLGGQPDYVQTYAYQLIRNKIYEAADQLSQVPNANRVQAMNDALHATSGHLSPHEQEEAIAMAADMLEANENCCYGHWSWR